MNKQHIENTIYMLRYKSAIRLNNLKKCKGNDNNDKLNDKLLDECIELLEIKIEEFESHIENGQYGEYY